MPLLTTIRQSPAYLYLKVYGLCALVTVFKAAPVTSRLPRIGEVLSLHKYKVINTRLGPRIVPIDPNEPSVRERAGRLGRSLSADLQRKSSMIISPELIGPWIRQSHPRAILDRWYQRTVDLARVKKLLREDDRDVRTYPEIEWDATVRRSADIHPEEKRFIDLRKERISSRGANSLHAFLELPVGEIVDPRDVPLISIGGSGGGYRATYGFAAFMSASKSLGLWDCITWTAGVSGSCWTIAAYYTLAYHDVGRLTKHYLRVAEELGHPMSIQALNTVARSSKGVYFLIGPLVRKAESGIIGLGIMDLYATLTTTYQFLSREPRARLSRATFQFSKVWTRSGLDKGQEPLPLLTAVRRAPQDSSGVKPHTDSSNSRGRPPEQALKQHETHVPSIMHIGKRLEDDVPDSTLANGFFQWFEISPIEVGSPDAQAYIPTWSWGRTFVSGRSFGRSPEQHLSLLLGQCTSAPSGPLTGYISALLASLPKGTFMSRVLLLLNNFVRMKRWEKLWGNPIRAGQDPNPFYGLNYNQNSSSDPDKAKWESQGRMRLMDSGMSNNLPNHVLARPERGADILISFDASSDVQRGSAVRRIQNFADDCNLTITEETELFRCPTPHFTGTQGGELSAAAKLELKHLHQYSRVFRCEQKDGKELYLIYCPLLPNAVNPDFDPSVRKADAP